MNHQPKTAALIAYDAGVLSAAGRARVERHLAGCEVCRAELATARLWTRESSRIRALSERPPVDFAKMEIGIARAATEQARVSRSADVMRRLDIAIPTFAIAAAVLLTVGLDRVSSPIVRPAGPPLAALWPDAVPSVLGLATVTLASGDARIIRDDVARAAVGGEPVEAGEALEVGAGELHVRFAEGTGLGVIGPGGFGPGGFGAAAARGSLAAPTAVLLAQIDDEAIEVALRGGRIAVETALPAAGSSAAGSARARSAGGSSLFVVLAAEYRIEARVARFLVDLDAPSGEVSIELLQGTATLVSGAERTTLVAPARWPMGVVAAGDVATGDAATGDVPALDVAVGSSARVAGLVAGADEWPTLTIERADIVRWELGEVRAAGGPSFSVRVPIGEHELVAYDAAGGSYRFLAIVGAGGLRAEGDDLTPDAPRVHEGSLPRAVLMSIVSESAGRLERCYQQALRLRALSGDVTARVRLSPRGVVMGVRVMSEDAPPSLERCVMTEAERWSFPPPGGPMSFDVPLSFRSR